MDAQSISEILSTRQQTGQAGQSESNDLLGKEDFLKMLVAQMQYQNPLEPLKDQEFIAQMTNFSSLEQLQNMNDTLSQDVQWNMLLSQTISNTMATSLIGREVTAESNVTSVTSDGATPIKFVSSSFVHEGSIIIRDSEGEVVRTLGAGQLQAGKNSIEWDGRDGNGNDLPPGSYSYELDLRDAQGNKVETQSYASGVVTGVRYFDGQAYLEVDGKYIPLSNIQNVSITEESGG